MSALSDLKWNLVGQEPNQEGKCIAVIVDRDGIAIARSSKRMTLEDALRQAEKFAELQEKVIAEGRAE